MPDTTPDDIPARAQAPSVNGRPGRRGGEGHALNLRNHHWSQPADPAELSFELYVDDVGAVIDRLGSGVVVVGHGMGGLLAMKAAERHPISGIVLVASAVPGRLRLPAPQHTLPEIPA